MNYMLKYVSICFGRGMVVLSPRRQGIGRDLQSCRVSWDAEARSCLMLPFFFWLFQLSFSLRIKNAFPLCCKIFKKMNLLNSFIIVFHNRINRLQVQLQNYLRQPFKSGFFPLTEVTIFGHSLEVTYGLSSTYFIP